MRLATPTLAMLTLIVPGIALAQDAPTLKTAPPVVINTVPTAGQGDVAPGLTKIQVTFSKRMTGNSWSWVQHTPDSFPSIVGEPQFLQDGRTCVIQVKLKPEQPYAIGINSQRHKNFKDTAGQSALPYLIVFRTAAAK